MVKIPTNPLTAMREASHNPDHDELLLTILSYAKLNDNPNALIYLSNVYRGYLSLQNMSHLWNNDKDKKKISDFIKYLNTLKKCIEHYLKLKNDAYGFNEYALVFTPNKQYQDDLSRISLLLNSLKSKKGRPKDISLDYLISQLIIFSKEFKIGTGLSRPNKGNDFSGPFFRFMNFALSEITQKKFDNQSLGMMLRRVRKGVSKSYF